MTGLDRMRLRVLLPTEVLLDLDVIQINAEAEDGAFSLLPRHLDWVTALAPGILSYRPVGDMKRAPTSDPIGVADSHAGANSHAGTETHAATQPFSDTDQDIEAYLAIDRGILVKVGQEVLVSTLNAVPGNRLEELHAVVAERFLGLDEHERQARSALARLEAGALRRFHLLQEARHG